MRARNVKPALFKNELLATSDPLHTWIFQGLWCMADRAGRLEDRPRRIHLEINPGRAYEGTETALSWLAESGFIIRYSHGDGQYIQIVNFTRHQNPHMREPASSIPAPGISTEQAPDFQANISAVESGAGTGAALDEHSAGPALSPSPLPDSPSLKEEGTRLNGARVPSKHIDAVFEHWRRTLEYPDAKLSEKRRKLIAARLKEYPLEKLRDAIDGYSLSPFHRGENDRNTRYDSLELILRDAKHVEQGLAFKAKPPKNGATRGTRYSKSEQALRDWTAGRGLDPDAI